MEAYYNCLKCKGHKVRILTRDGKQYTGVIHDVDYNNVYLKPDKGSVTTSAFYPYGFGYPYGYNQDIITLSLFTLLAIALI